MACHERSRGLALPVPYILAPSQRAVILEPLPNARMGDRFESVGVRENKVWRKKVNISCCFDGCHEVS